MKIALRLCLLLMCARTPIAADINTCVPQNVLKKTTLILPHQKTITIDVVDTPNSREIGLMCRTELSSNYGMLFVFPQEMSLNFWMKNTLVSLDILWIGADKKINVIHSRLHPSTIDTPDDKIDRATGFGQYVLELPAGMAKRHRLKAGDQLKFDVVIPPL